MYIQTYVNSRLAALIDKNILLIQLSDNQPSWWSLYLLQSLQVPLPASSNVHQVCNTSSHIWIYYKAEWYSSLPHNNNYQKFPILILGGQPKEEIVRSNVLTNNDVTRQQERSRTRGQQNLENNSFSSGRFYYQ